MAEILSPSLLRPMDALMLVVDQLDEIEHIADGIEKGKLAPA